MTANNQAAVLGALAMRQQNLVEGQVALINELKQDRLALGGLTGAVHELAGEIKTERKERQSADARINERIDRMAKAEAFKTVVRWMPLAALVGAAGAWVLKEGPAIIIAWWGLPTVLYP